MDSVNGIWEMLSSCLTLALASLLIYQCLNNSKILILENSLVQKDRDEIYTVGS